MYLYLYLYESNESSLTNVYDLLLSIIAYRTSNIIKYQYLSMERFGMAYATHLSEKMWRLHYTKTKSLFHKYTRNIPYSPCIVFFNGYFLLHEINHSSTSIRLLQETWAGYSGACVLARNGWTPLLIMGICWGYTNHHSFFSFNGNLMGYN